MDARLAPAVRAREKLPDGKKEKASPLNIKSLLVHYF
jgi:hypothetical protein